MNKTCSKCKTSKPISEFYHNKSMPDGLDYYCKPCRRLGLNKKYDNSRYRKNNRELLTSLKTECRKCGEDRPWMIQFHHVKPTNKKFNVTMAGTRSERSIVREISKCICLCANCHIEFHHFYGKRPRDPVAALEEYLSTDKLTK